MSGYLWDLDDSTQTRENNFTYNYKEDGVYNIALIATNEQCTYHVSQLTNVTTIAIPNVITPNDDDKNTFFVIQADSTVSLQIFNRWGNSVYKNEDYLNTWNADGLDAAVYYYIADIKDKTTCKGWVQVLK